MCVTVLRFLIVVLLLSVACASVIDLSNVFEVRSGLTIVCHGRGSSLLELMFRWTYFPDAITNFPKVYFVLATSLSGFLLIVLLTKIFRRFRVLFFGSNPSTHCGAALLRCSTSYHKNSFSSGICSHVMRSSKVSESFSDCNDISARGSNVSLTQIFDNRFIKIVRIAKPPVEF